MGNLKKLEQKEKTSSKSKTETSKQKFANLSENQILSDGNFKTATINLESEIRSTHENSEQNPQEQKNKINNEGDSQNSSAKNEGKENFKIEKSSVTIEHPKVNTEQINFLNAKARFESSRLGQIPQESSTFYMSASVCAPDSFGNSKESKL